MKNLAAYLLISLLAPRVIAQGSKQDDAMKKCPMHAQHQSHDAVLERHGDEAMGFPHEKTTHHFRMLDDGGAIEVAVNDSSDKPNMEAIRSHLSHIEVMFRSGDFSAPMFIHDGVPPGVTTMKLMRGAIRYAYDETSTGGKVRIQSTDAVAVAAIHDFLRFQIAEHKTGDSLEVQHR